MSLIESVQAPDNYPLEHHIAPADLRYDAQGSIAELGPYYLCYHVPNPPATESSASETPR